MLPANYYDVSRLIAGKSAHTLMMFEFFIGKFEQIGDIKIETTKTMIGISNSHKRIAWITQLGKNFIHVVLPLREPHYDNLCFQKVAQVPGSNQYNHHLRLLQPDDINDEVLSFMKLAYQL